MEPWKELRGKVVMVTGASSGIGREFSLDLAKSGCRIIAAARRVDRLKSLCDEINSEGPRRAIAVELDVTANGATIEAAVQIAWDAFGRIDALVNNAGLRGSLAYASSKMALDMVTKMMALELGVSPGVFKSEITESLMEKDRNGSTKPFLNRSGFNISCEVLQNIYRAMFSLWTQELPYQVSPFSHHSSLYN
ncbi:uncharacterized protein LOC107805707 [Nicotiana tabacum]|uniref:Dehydrogenase/reductase SDR family member 7 n=2 Tax=Nicotiana TaxID=4085 RepID=A0A1S4B8L0_TOBAC|nr:PREDICTED: dehydrogenase/reductase SDR family member 7-like [Nicotiana sylvestris]XP_009792302.1 PREDICTED: dehydrogenase/reductase SDR family member 7-like [Nicotiana sylvestris]XP_016485264.1 PREDICTED: dehydrogenase/reductase SDR family member 7-like [Nicotiana tabacum]XP_016485265.1 PREDICTED: dehydrogenase/reductase SDR family member 7-like [Nicotiana tabacum]